LADYAILVFDDGDTASHDFLANSEPSINTVVCAKSEIVDAPVILHVNPEKGIVEILKNKNGCSEC